MPFHWGCSRQHAATSGQSTCGRGNRLGHSGAKEQEIISLYASMKCLVYLSPVVYTASDRLENRIALTNDR